MRKVVGRRTIGVLAVALVGVLVLATQVIAAAGTSRSAQDGAVSLRMFYGSPAIVRAGEQVRVPVQVVCVTSAEAPCPAAVTLRVGSGLLERTATGTANPLLRFDVTNVASRALAGGLGSAFVPLGLTARAPGVPAVRLPVGGIADHLGFYVLERLPIVRVPRIGLDAVRRGHAVLSLGWGSGAGDAGLVIGNESQTYGPSGFDVDAAGRIHLLDTVSNRIAVFAAGGGLVRSTPLSSDYEHAGIAVATDGRAYVLERRQHTNDLGVAEVSAAGAAGPVVHALDGVPVQIRATEDGPALQSMPMDAWLSHKAVRMGLPFSNGHELVSTATETTLRIATVRGGSVLDAVELRFDQGIGAVMLVQSDGLGGYYAVVRIPLAGAPNPYAVVHVLADHSVRTFAVPSGDHANSPPANRFRIGPDGGLYELITSPEGMRILRHDLEEDVR